MKKLTENLANLLKVKTIVTLVVIFVFAWLSLTGAISADNVMIIISMVVSFYFGTQHEKTGVADRTNANTEVVATITEKATPAPEPVHTATYNETHPDSV